MTSDGTWTKCPDNAVWIRSNILQVDITAVGHQQISNRNEQFRSLWKGVVVMADIPLLPPKRAKWWQLVLAVLIASVPDLLVGLLSNIPGEGAIPRPNVAEGGAELRPSADEPLVLSVSDDLYLTLRRR